MLQYHVYQNYSRNSEAQSATDSMTIDAADAFFNISLAP